MKVDRIKNISGVGRFKSFVGTNDELAFEDNTFILGKNTHGKSTLSAIFRSIRENSGDYVIGRKAFGYVGAQSVVIKVSGSTKDIVFNGTTWSGNIPIRIFDNKYISDNIYSDDYISEDKQHKIASIILGDEGQRLEEAYDKAKLELDKNTKTKTEITNIYNKTFDSKKLGFQEFRSLKEDKALDTEILKLDKAIESLKNQDGIKNALGVLTPELSKLSQIDAKLLQESLEVNQEDINKHIKNNISREEEALGFLSEGLNLLKGADASGVRSCAFCGQELSEKAEELIAQYELLFSEKYIRLSQNITSNITFLRNWNISQRLLEAKLILQKMGVDFEIEKYTTNLTNGIKSLLGELESKQANLNHCIEIDKYDSLATNLARVLTDVVNPIKEKFSLPIDQAELITLEEKKTIYEIKKQRFVEPWASQCDEYNRLDEKFTKALKPSEAKAFDEKKNYAEKVFVECERKINHILGRLGANFELVDFEVPQNRRDSLKLFSLKFDGEHKVSLQGEEATSNLKNTLSDSDKRMLSFAFFVVDIQNSKTLADTIVLLDDPMSSLDIERKITTIKVLRDELISQIGDSPAQLIVLTHEENFFKYLDDHFSTAKKFLKVEYSATDKTSKLVPCDTKEEFKEDHFKRIDTLKAFLDGSINECDLGDIRHILEGAICYKHYQNIPRDVIERGGVISYYLNSLNPTSEVKLRINDLFPHLPHHYQLSTKDESSLSEGDKKSLISGLMLILREI